MEIKITLGAFVARAYAYFFAAIALKWELRVDKFQRMWRVAEVGNLTILHGV